MEYAYAWTKIKSIETSQNVLCSTFFKFYFSFNNERAMRITLVFFWQ